MKGIIEEALKSGQKSLSEYQSKVFLKSFGIPTTPEEIAKTEKEAIEIAKKIGFPVALKGVSPEITHKTELKLIELNIKDEAALKEAYKKLSERKDVKLDGVLVQKMVKGDRELVVGLTRDPQFGPCVMFGLGGIFTEVLKDVSFRIAPLEKRDALEMMGEIKAHKILDAFRGQDPVDRDVLADILMSIGKIGLEYDAVKEIDINPLIVTGEGLMAVDALVVLDN
ncbi:MAG: acetate--CoA ligase family protein [Thermodesulfobacteriota bacterium]|nr:acetate--CoA ligase family protein [Thermodesulfobacteriota bacterium]